MGVQCDGLSDEGEEVTVLLAAGFDDSQEGFGETAAGVTLRAEGELPRDRGVT